MQYFFIQFVIEGSESNCHPKEIDVSLVSSGANLKLKGADVAKKKKIFLV